MRVKIIKQTKGYSPGQIVDVSKNEAFGLIDSGYGVISKDMTAQDYKITKSDEEQADGKPTFVRTHKRK